MAQQQENTDQQEESLHISQSMIDVYSQRLIGLRTQCATSAELTQQEIRSLEGKLIKMFSSQLAVKAELRRTNGTANVLSKYERIPNLEQWLQVVGLRAESVKAVCARVNSLEELQERKCWEEELKPLLGKRQEELQRLCRALDNLRRYTAMVREGTLGMDGNDSGSNMCLLDCGMQQLTASLTDNDEHSHSGSTSSICIPPLYWDSWDRRRDTTACTTSCSQSSSSSPRPSRPRPSYRASIPNEESQLGGLHYHGIAGDDNDVTVTVSVPVASPGACLAAPMLVVSPTSATSASVLSPVACHDGVLTKTPVLESVAIPFECNGSAISSSVSSNALYYACNVKIPACPVSPTFNITRKPPGLTNCRTPPACRKNTCLPSGTASVLPPLCGTPTSLEFPSNLTKSKSHESQLANDQPSSPIDNNRLTNSTSNKNDNNNQFSDQLTCVAGGQVGILSSPLLRRERLPTEPGPEYGSNYDVTQLLDVQHQHHHQSFVEQHYNSGYRQVHVNVVPGDVMCSAGTTAAPLTSGTKVVSQTAPASPRVLRHRIAHRFQKTFKMMASCAVCLKPIYFGTGLRCKECKYRCHRDCEDSAVPSCGLTPELLKAVGAQFQDGFGNAVIGPGNCVPNRRKNSAPPLQIGGTLQGYQPSGFPLKDHQFSGSGIISSLLYNKHKFHNQNQQQSHGSQSQSPQLLPGGSKHHSSSSTTSSCNSSAPSSPAPPHVNTLNVIPGGGSTTNSASSTVSVTRSSFHFPDSVLGGNTTTLLDHLQKDKTNSCSDQQQYTTPAINNHEHTTTTNHEPPPSSPLAPTPTRVDSQDSQVSSDTETLIDGATTTTVTGSGAGSTVTNSSAGNQRQNSMTTALKEWDIPFSELVLEGPGPLGAGRFGTVWRGQWHGDVAIKVLHGQDEARTLHQFRSDVSTFRKTRHENLVLFMGACTRPPHLAIVTSLCKGQTLHALVHLRRERFSLARAAAIAQQISQGMGYLHAKGILHKDLTSKNVFLENQGTKVVITDFGLFSGLREMMGDSSGSRLAVPPGWLCYLAPELVRALTPTPPPPSVQSMSSGAALSQQLPFSRAADVFAFGTIWFELLCGDWPFRGEPAEAVIWQVGAGRKVSLTNLHATKDVKDVLMACWAYKPTDREDFALLLERLRRLPTAKRLARSPSHPVHLSRSAESVF